MLLAYKDSILVIAQIFSILGLPLSWTVLKNGVYYYFDTSDAAAWASFVVVTTSFLGFLLLQVAWCCKLSKCGLITAGVFCIVAGLAAIIFSGIRFAVQSAPGIFVSDFLGGTLMLACGILTLVFSCGPRLQKLQQQQNAQDDRDDDGYIPVVPTIVSDGSSAKNVGFTSPIATGTAPSDALDAAGRTPDVYFPPPISSPVPMQHVWKCLRKTKPSCSCDPSCEDSRGPTMVKKSWNNTSFVKRAPS